MSQMFDGDPGSFFFLKWKKDIQKKKKKFFDIKQKLIRKSNI